MRAPRCRVSGPGAGARVVLLSGAWWLVAEGLFEGYEGGALGGGADFAVDVGGGVQVGVAEDGGGDV